MMKFTIIVFVAIFALSFAAPAEEKVEKKEEKSEELTSDDVKLIKQEIKDFFNLTANEKDAISDIIELKNLLLDAIEEGVKKFESLTDGEKKALLENMIKDAKQKLGDFLKGAAKELGTVVASVFDLIGNIVEGFHEGIQERMNAEKTKEEDKAKEVEVKIGNFLAAGFTALDGIFKVVDEIATDVVKGIATVAGDVINGLKAALDDKDGLLKGLEERLKDILENLDSASLEESAESIEINVEASSDSSDSGIENLVAILEAGSASAEVIENLKSFESSSSSIEISVEGDLLGKFISTGFEKVQDFVHGVLEFISIIHDVFEEEGDGKDSGVTTQPLEKPKA